MLGVPAGAPGASAFVPSHLVRHAYVEQGILTESPTQLVLTVLDFTLGAARKGDAGKVKTGFQELLESLDYRYDTAWSLQAFYEACLALVDRGEFEEATQHLQEVRDNWASAFRLSSKSAPTPFVRSVPHGGFEGQA